MDNLGVAPPQITKPLEDKTLPDNTVVNVQAVVPPDEAPIPQELKNLDKVVSGGGDVKDRLQAVSDITKINSETKDYHPNMQPQWGGVIASLLGRDYKSALKYYNGGPISEELGRDATGKEYYKLYNQMGEINVIKDKDTGRELSPKEKQEIMARGGVITKLDEQAMKGISWKNAQANAEMARLGINTPLNKAYVDVNNAVTTANSANNNIEEQIALSKKLAIPLDTIAKMGPEARAKLMGIAQQYITISNNLSKQNDKSLGVNAGVNTQNGVSVGGNANVGNSLTGGAGLSGGVSSTTGTNQGANARQAIGENASAGTSQQVQQGLLQAMQQELVGVMNPEQFKDFIRLQSLNAKNQEDYSAIPDTVKPPGWESVPETDVMSGGVKSVIANRATQQKNNALMVAWSKELYRAEKRQAQTGEQVDLDQLREDFQNSDIFKAINNTFYSKLHKHLTGEDLPQESGSLVVDNQNRIHRVK
jgi:hypothetical protein